MDMKYLIVLVVVVIVALADVALGMYSFTVILFCLPKKFSCEFCCVNVEEF